MLRAPNYKTRHEIAEAITAYNAAHPLDKWVRLVEGGRYGALRPDGELVLISAFGSGDGKSVQLIPIGKAGDSGLPLAGNANATAKTNITFGLVIERVINHRSAGTNCFLNLATGKLITPPAEIASDFGPEDSGSSWGSRFFGDKASEMQQWPASARADLMAGAGHTSGPGEDKGLTMFGGLSLGPEDWNAATPEGIVETIRAAEEQIPKATHEPMPFSFMRVGEELPKAFAFKTREGSVGILQITGFTKVPRGVKICYKVVEAEPAPKKASAARSDEPLRATNSTSTNSLEAAPILARDVALNFADPTASDGTFHSKPRASFDLDLHEAARLPEGGFAVASMLIGQMDFVVGLVGSPVGTRIDVHDMSEKTLVNETWNNRSNRFEKLFTLPVNYGRKPYSCPVQLELGRLPDGKCWGAYRFCAYLSGHVSLGGAERNFELVNVDRRITFANSGTEDKPVEVLGIDLNGDGKIDPSPDGGEIFAFDEAFQIGAKHYRVVEANLSEPKVGFQEVTEPDYVKAQETLKQAYGVAGALEETFKKQDDLKLAQMLASQMLEKLRAYNALVGGTPVELPQTNLQVVAGLVSALQAGKWDEAKNSTDSGPDLANPTQELEDLAAIQRARSFGPVRERVLPFKWKTGTPYCLDFESSNLVTPPARLTVIGIAWDQWCAQGGVDALAEERKSGPVIWGQGTIFTKVETARWDTIRPARVVKELLGNNVVGNAELPNRKAIPATFQFKTREGGRGVLQIAGFTDNPLGMKIRYKLVE